MALGKVSSLGFGSQVLTQDVINKLKAADEAGQIKPVTNKIAANAKDIFQKICLKSKRRIRAILVYFRLPSVLMEMYKSYG